MKAPVVIHICGILNILLYVFPIASSWLFDSPGELKPDDPYVLLGEDLVLRCSLSSTSNYNSSQLRFTYGRDVAVPQENVALVSESLAVMTLTVTNVTQFQGIMFNCWAPHTLIGSQTITVEYRSRVVTGLQCEVRDWELMRCGWSLGRYENLRDINVTLIWTMEGAPQWSSCSDLTKTSCEWDMSEFPRMDEMLMNITVSNNRIPSVASAMFSVKVNEIVKPSAVRHLVSETVNSGCVQLWWNHTHTVKGIIYRVNYTDGNTLVTALKNRTMDNYRVCGLSPFTDYTFFVEAHPNKTRGFWSDPSQTSSKTAEDVPDVGPNITSGSYMEECLNNDRNVTLYFKAPKEEFRNGILTGYKLEIKDRDSGLTHSEFVHARDTSLRLTLKCDIVYNVKMSAMTRAGVSKSSSHITINRYAAVAAPRLRIQTAENGFSPVVAKWDEPDDDNPTLTTTVFWCKRLQSPNSCKEPFDWVVVQGRKEVEIPVKNVDNSLFAVSRNTATGSSGLAWSWCIYQFNKRPDVPGDVRVSNSGKDLTLNVMWNSQWCNSNHMSLLSKYIIHFNTVGSSEPNTSVPVEPFHSNYELSGLKKVNYSIWMQAESDNGTLGPISEPVFGVPVDNRLTTGEIVAIVFGCLFGLFFIGAGIFFIIRTCQGGCRRDQISFPRGKKYILDYLVPDNKQNGDYAAFEHEKDVDTESISGKTQALPQTDLVIGRQMSTVSTDSGRATLVDSKKSCGTSPQSSTFPPLKEDEEWNKVSTDSESSHSDRPPDYSRFTKEEDSDSAKQAKDTSPPKQEEENNPRQEAENTPKQEADNSNYKTVGFLLGQSNPMFDQSEEGGVGAASGKRSELVSEHTVDPYVTVGNDGNVEVVDSFKDYIALPETDAKMISAAEEEDGSTEQMCSSDGFSPDRVPGYICDHSLNPNVTTEDNGSVEAKDSSDGIPKPDEKSEPDSGQSVDPYMIITDDGKITPAEISTPSNDKNTNSCDMKDPSRFDEKPAASPAQAADSACDDYTNHFPILRMDSSCQDPPPPPPAQEDISGDDLSPAEVSISQQSLSSSGQSSQPSPDTDDVKQADSSEPPYVDANFSPCMANSDPSDYVTV